MTSPSEKALFDALASLKFLKNEGASDSANYHCVIFPVVEYAEYDVQAGQASDKSFVDYGTNFGFNVSGVDVDLMIEMLEKLVKFQLSGGNLDIFLEMILKYPGEPPRREEEYSDWHTIYYDENGNIIREEKQQ